MKYLRFVLSIIVTLFVLSACSENANDSANKEGTLNVQTVQDKWTYVSLSSGKIIGTSALGDSTAEAAWKHRMDWDVALCNGMIRTNSGTSGNGHASIVSSPAAYEQADVAPESDYQIDADTIAIW